MRTFIVAVCDGQGSVKRVLGFVEAETPQAAASSLAVTLLTIHEWQDGRQSATIIHPETCFRLTGEEGLEASALSNLRLVEVAPVIGRLHDFVASLPGTRTGADWARYVDAKAQKLRAQRV